MRGKIEKCIYRDMNDSYPYVRINNIFYIFGLLFIFLIFYNALCYFFKVFHNKLCLLFFRHIVSQNRNMFSINPEFCFFFHIFFNLKIITDTQKVANKQKGRSPESLSQTVPMLTSFRIIAQYHNQKVDTGTSHRGYLDFTIYIGTLVCVAAVAGGDERRGLCNFITCSFA